MSRQRVSWIAHEGLAVQNPMTTDDLDRVVEACDLAPHDLAVDIGCGSGEFLSRVVARSRCRGVGIDASPLAITRARRHPQPVEWRVDDGRSHRLLPGEAALVASIGATHVFGLLADTLSAIVPLVRRGGFVVVGDGYWRTEPTDEWLAALGGRRDEFGTRDELIAAVEGDGLRILLTVDASAAEIDAYNGAWYANLERHLSAHPLDRDSSEITAALAHARQWQPQCSRYLGFAVIVANRR